jgi:glycosyltransferase involved in cell wall biosynthesis
MSLSNKPTVTVVIPVYNDERYIGECLDALCNQTSKPYEIIVVDNNCIDKSIDIVKKYKNVIIKRQKVQGLSHARNMGFNCARGDIIVRIDADTQVPPDYIDRLRVIFNDKATGAVTGYAISRFELIPKTSIAWNWLYHAYVEAYLGYKVLYGANMAIRRSLWGEINDLVLNDDAATHEDQDLSLALASVGVKVRVYPKLVVSVNTQSLQSYQKFKLYHQLLKNTKVIDINHPRSNTPNRLPKSHFIRRLFLWVSSVWAIYVYYFFAIIYSAYLKLAKADF